MCRIDQQTSLKSSQLIWLAFNEEKDRGFCYSKPQKKIIHQANPWHINQIGFTLTQILTLNLLNKLDRKQLNWQKYSIVLIR